MYKHINTEIETGPLKIMSSLRGSSSLELALVLPVFLFALFVTVETGMTVATYASMEKAIEQVRDRDRIAISARASETDSEIRFNNSSFIFEALDTIEANSLPFYRSVCDNYNTGSRPFVEKRFSYTEGMFNSFSSNTSTNGDAPYAIIYTINCESQPILPFANVLNGVYRFQSILVLG